MADPVYGEFVTLRGLISLAGLQRGQLKTVVWNKQNEQLVALGYAEIYTGTGAPPPVLDPYATREWVQSQLADVEVSDADLAATVAAASATRTAVDARVRAVGDATYAPTDVVENAGIIALPESSGLSLAASTTTTPIRPLCAKNNGPALMFFDMRQYADFAPLGDVRSVNAK